jgi:hypothetical protein
MRRRDGWRVSVADVLAWADAHHARTGRWPRILEADTGPLPPGLTWRRLDGALRHGTLGLPGGGSLPRLLARERGAPRAGRLPPLTVGQVLRWADEHHRRTGSWPAMLSGTVRGAPGPLSWLALNSALLHGFRGLPSGEGLRGFLARHGRGGPVRPPRRLRAGG